MAKSKTSEKSGYESSFQSAYAMLKPESKLTY